MLCNRACTIVLFAAVASGCASVNHRHDIAGTSVVDTTVEMTPYEAIQRAAAAAPQSVPGPFVLRIQAVAKHPEYTYLNSELDYRDQRNLTIAVTSPAVRALTARMGSALESGLIGKHLRVHGVARRVKIVFFANGKATNKYYYQTHVTVTDAAQIELLPELGQTR